MRSLFILSFVVLLAFLLAGCSQAQSSTNPPEVQALESYVRALAAKDEAAYSRLICPSWEAQAFLEYDAYQGVESRLGDLSCRRTGGQGNAATVSCQGKITLSYGVEKQEVDLATRSYQLVSSGGSWQVCGYTSTGQ